MIRSGRKKSASPAPPPPTSSKHKSTSTKTTKSKSKSKSSTKSNLPGQEHQPTLSEEEYHNLPICIQRKYFSSLERLHIAYNSVHQSHPSSANGRAYPCGSSVDSTTPIAHRHFGRSSRSPTPHHINSSPAPNSRSSFVPGQRTDYHHANDSQASFGGVLAVQAEAQWFMSLPDKVRSQLFDREEQQSLFAALERYHLQQRSDSAQRNKSRTSTKHRKTHSSKQTSTATHSSSDRTDKHRSVRRSRRSPPESDMDYSSRGRTSERDAYGRINQSSTQAHWNSTSPSPIPKSPIFPGHRRDRSHATMASITRPSVDTSVPAYDPEAVYYRSPEARLKLRQYLASPQKFDEALTYGFPSDAPPEQVHQTYRYPYNTGHNDAKAFLNHDMISFIDNSTLSDPELEDERSDETSDNDTDSPATPGDASFTWQASRYNRVSIFGGLNSDSMPSLDLKFQPELLSPRTSTNPFNDALLNREMTLRMTLTRPDLRANEEDIYNHRRPTQDEQDLLALDSLPSPVEDTSGAYGAFAVAPKKSKRSSKVPTQKPPKSSKSKSSKSSTGTGFSKLFGLLRGK